MEKENITYLEWIIQIYKQSTLGLLSILATIVFSICATGYSVYIFIKKATKSVNDLNPDHIILIMIFGAFINLLVIAFAIWINKNESLPTREIFNSLIGKMKYRGLYPENNPFFTDEEKYYEYVRVSSVFFKNSWFWFLFFLFVLYLLLLPNYFYMLDIGEEKTTSTFFIGTLELNADKSVKGTIEEDNKLRYLYSAILGLIFNIRSLYVYICYKILHKLKSTEEINKMSEYKEYKSIYNSWLIKGLGTALGLFVLHIGLCLMLNDDKLSKQVNYLFLIIAGVWGGFTMAMVATHFESRVISMDIKSSTVLLILIYAAIHSLFVMITPESEFQLIAIILLIAALILKVHLFLFVWYLYQRGKMTTYFITMPALVHKIGDLPIGNFNKDK